LTLSGKGFPSAKRVLTLDTSFVLHRWLADNRKRKNPKASKRDGCEMIVTLKVPHRHSNRRLFDFEASI
jgi:hypothetical protein